MCKKKKLLTVCCLDGVNPRGDQLKRQKLPAATASAAPVFVPAGAALLTGVPLPILHSKPFPIL